MSPQPQTALPSPSSTLPPADSLILPPFATFQIRQMIAAGSSGLVFEAIQGIEQDAPHVTALHVPYVRNQKNPEFCEKYLRQANQLRRFTHPRLCRIRSSGHTGLCWREMERVKGWSMTALWRKCMSRQLELPWALSLELIRQIGEGLDFLHRQDRAHTRLSMGRILLLPEGEVKLCGWNMADPLLSTEAASSTALAELAPEQLMGQPGTTASDVYRLSLIAATMLLGSNPFQRRTATAIRESILADRLDLSPLACPPMEALLSQGLARHAPDRPTIQSFLSDLQTLSTSPNVPSASPEARPIQGVSTLPELLHTLFPDPPQIPPHSPEMIVELRALQELVADQRGTQDWTPNMMNQMPAGRAPSLLPRQNTDSASSIRLPRISRTDLTGASSTLLPRLNAPDTLPAGASSTLLPRLNALDSSASSSRLPRLNAPDGSASSSRLPRLNAPDPRPSSASSTLLPRLNAPDGSISSSRLPRLGTPEPGSADPLLSSSVRLPRQASTYEQSRLNLPRLQPVPPTFSRLLPESLLQHLPGTELLTGMAIGLGAALIGLGLHALLSAAPWAAQAPGGQLVLRPGLSTPATAAPLTAPAAGARLVNLSVTSRPDRLTLNGMVEGDARAMGFLIDEPGRCQYRVRLRNTVADEALTQLKIQSPLLLGFQIRQEEGATLLQFDCEPGRIEPSLTTSPERFEIVIAQRP